MTQIAIDALAIEERRRERAQRMALTEIPAMRAIGMVFLSFGVFLNDRYVLGQTSFVPWLQVTTVLIVYTALSWAMLSLFYESLRPRDLSLYFLVADVFVWTYVVYASGAERSWLFFILLLRVADQTQTTFRRCIGFAALTTACLAAMCLYILLVDGRPIEP
ncbi:MAG: hypothetical protein ACXVIJ_05355, partial [Thermoanaerobaculia bacterium]